MGKELEFLSQITKEHFEINCRGIMLIRRFSGAHRSRLGRFLWNNNHAFVRDQEDDSQAILDCTQRFILNQ
jgi:hypothetical protein